MLDSSSTEDEDNGGNFPLHNQKATDSSTAPARLLRSHTPCRHGGLNRSSSVAVQNISSAIVGSSVHDNRTEAKFSEPVIRASAGQSLNLHHELSEHVVGNATGPLESSRSVITGVNSTVSRSNRSGSRRSLTSASHTIGFDRQSTRSHLNDGDLRQSTSSLDKTSFPDRSNFYPSGTRSSSTSSVNSSNFDVRPAARSSPPESAPYGDQRVSNSPSAGSQNFDEVSLLHPSISVPKDPATLELEKTEREEQERRKALQVYVFVMRCIAYTFYSKPPTDLVRRYLKITKQQLNAFKERFQTYLNGELDVIGDEAFTNAIQSYYEVFLRSDRVATMVRGGGCSMHDFREVFRLNSEHRVRCLPQIEGLNKSNVVSAWMVKFDQICRGGAGPSTELQKLQVPQPELVMTKEQLYDLFQATLGVKKYEHQILYNALQLDNADEQAAQVRRELDGQLQTVEVLAKNRQFPRLVVKDMEPLYIEELKKMVGELMLRLEAVPITKASTSFQKFKKHNRSASGTSGGSTNALYRQLSEEASEITVKNKPDIHLTFSLEVVVGQVKNLKHLPSNKMVYCTMEIEGGEKLQTDLAEAGKPSWGTQGDFATSQPLPVVKVKLYMESSGILSLESGKELGKVTLNPTCAGSRQPEWYKLQTVKGVPGDLDILLTVRMDKPTNLKYCGYLYALGRTAFRKWKRRYICLVQVSQYTFIMASYKQRKSDPSEIMHLEGFTVDFCDAFPELTGLGGKFFFNLVKEGDSATFASDDANERQLWVQAIYRSTGQTHKPVLPAKDNTSAGTGCNPGVSPSSGSSRAQLNLAARTQGDVDRARKHGLDEFVVVEPWRVNHAELFHLLQSRSLEHRMKDPYVSLGWFSPSQMFILDEYCARYGVRGCHRHLCYLSSLLDRAEHGIMIDPALVHYSYAFCCCHVFGNAQDSSIRTVLYEEREMFLEIRQRLYTLLTKQITEFRYYFPFGRPEGALKLTFGLLERVLMKDTGAPASAEEVREVIRGCLEQAALVNYTRISEYAAIESGRDTGAPPAQQHRTKSLPGLIHLAELCIEVLRQNEEHHSEAFSWFHDLLIEHAELFWNLFSTDMTSVLETMPPDCWDSFPLFQLLNDYLLSEESLKSGKFHQQLTQTFAPLVVRYVDLMEASITQSIGVPESPSPGDVHETGMPAAIAALSNADAFASVGSLVSAATAATRSGGLIAAASAVTGPNASFNPMPVTSAELLWKLEALQTFIRELHWPDPVFAEHLDNRLKLMASDMIDVAARRNLSCFETWLKRSSKGPDFILPNECCNMINTVADLKANILKLCTKDTKGEDMHQYHNQTETNLERIQRKMAIVLNEKMATILEGNLAKLARYDVNTLLSSVLSLTKPTDEGGKVYVEFLRVNLEQMRQKITDELYVLSFMETWYMTQTRMINDWLTERKGNALSPYQFTCLSTIIKKMYADFELQGISPDALDTMAYKTVTQRLQMEETAQAMRPDSHTSPSRSILDSITGGLTGLSGGFTKTGFLGKS